MAERAHYLVTVPPGAPIPGLGFVKVGDSFFAPSEDYVPSRTFRAMNEPARQALVKLRDQIKAQHEEAAKKKPEPPKPWDGIRDDIFVPPGKDKSIERETVRAEDWGRLDADQAKTAAPASKRTADR